MNKKSKSVIPQGAITFETGSNYGLDGFFADMDYNQGVLDGARLPETKGLAELPGDLVPEPSVSELPIGVVRGEDEGLGNLSDFLKEGSLADLNWLEIAEQDLDRLPKSPHSSAIKELEQAWGVNRRTDGLQLIPNVDKEVMDYETILNAEGEMKKTSTTKEDLLRVGRWALRMATFREPWANIIEAVERELGPESSRIKAAMDAVQKDYPLLGNVFLRASAFPGCHRGEWKDLVRQRAASARYLIPKNACGDCIHAQEGRCAIFKKAMTTKVPWKDALDYYGPKLKAAGYKLSADKNPRTVLARVFQSTPKAIKSLDGHKPVQVQPADRVSTEEAQQVFQNAPKVQQEQVSHKEHQAAIERKAVFDHIRKWNKAGLLRDDDAASLITAGVDPKIILRTAASLITMPRDISKYAGMGLSFIQTIPKISREKALQKLKNAWSKAAYEQNQLQQLLQDRAASRIKAMIKAGLLKNVEGKKLLKMDISPERKMKLAFAVVSKRASEEVPIPTSRAAQVYAGEGKTAIAWRKDAPMSLNDAQASLQGVGDPHSEQSRKLAEKLSQQIKDRVVKMVQAGLITKEEANTLIRAKLDLGNTLKYAAALVGKRQMEPATIPKKAQKKKAYRGEGEGAEGITFDLSAHEAQELLKKSGDGRRYTDIQIEAVVKFAMQEMNEGVAGVALTQVLSAKFDSPLLKEASRSLKKARRQHEGLAGHLYVDASVYASPRGNDGCKHGAAKHRANQVKHLLEMERCGSCVARNVEGRCNKYGKVLVGSPTEALGIRGYDITDVSRRTFQQEMIRLANGSDQDRTAALFEAGTDPVSEFGLQFNTDIEISEDTSQGSLGGITFGGMVIPED